MLCSVIIISKVFRCALKEYWTEYVLLNITFKVKASLVWQTWFLTAYASEFNQRACKVSSQILAFYLALHCLWYLIFMTHTEFKHKVGVYPWEICSVHFYINLCCEEGGWRYLFMFIFHLLVYIINIFKKVLQTY